MFIDNTRLHEKSIINYNNRPLFIANQDGSGHFASWVLVFVF